MTNSNIFYSSKKLFFLNVVLFLIIRSSVAHAGLIELYHLKTTDDKSIILLGDDHYVYNSQETEEMVNLIKDQEQKKNSITLLVEQALNNGQGTVFSGRILESLPKLLNMYPLDKTVVQNIEVRSVSNAILTLLNPDTDLNNWPADSFFQNGSCPKIEISTITFQQLYDEYEQLTQTLSAQYKQYDDARIQHLFEQQVDIANQHYEQLQYVINKWKNKYGINENEAIVNLVKNLQKAEQIKLTQRIDDNKERLTLSEKLMVYIFRVFIPLFNVNAFDRIIQQKMSSDIVLLVAGAAHAKDMKDWLVSCDEMLVQSIVNNDDIDSYVTNNDIITILATILSVENPTIY